MRVCPNCREHRVDMRSLGLLKGYFVEGSQFTRVKSFNGEPTHDFHCTYANREMAVDLIAVEV